MNFGKRLRGFTLVEMLIVIVIIGVLAAALIPRLTSVRGRANDVARKADLQQVATAIVSYSMDKGEYPPCTISTGCDIATLTGELKTYVTTLPDDPQSSNQYTYILAKKGNVNSGGFILMSIAETDGGSNRAISGSLNELTGGIDTQTITPCSKMTQSDTTGVNLENKSNCYYKNPDQLRYIIAR